MKRVWQVVLVAALCGMATSSWADVQNIRLSGDIRIRGYYLARAGDDGAGDQSQSDASFISERTRVSVEADLEDHVLVVVTLKAEGLWGGDDNTGVDSGAGTGNGQVIDRGFAVGVNEAYVQLNEMFYTPATLKLGRQFLNYGRGLILSSADQEYNYDAARLVLDYYPLTIDIVGAQLVNNQTFSATATQAGSADLLFINGRYELSDSAIKDIEAYFGWVGQGSSGPITSSRVPPTADSASPLIIGLRSDMNLTEGLNTWIEGAYEFGADGTTGDKNISAFLFNAGFRFDRKNSNWSPVFNGNYIFASGGGESGRNYFRPWFDYADGYNGYLFAPALTDIHIFNLGASVRPSENATLGLQAYYYLKADRDGVAGSNANVDFGGLGFSPQANSRELGWEFDWLAGYDYSKDVRCQLVWAMFIPQGAFTKGGPSDSVAHEVRGEVGVKF